jgi:hypothetical protein
MKPKKVKAAYPGQVSRVKGDARFRSELSSGGVVHARRGSGKSEADWSRFKEAPAWPPAKRGRNRRA